MTGIGIIGAGHFGAVHARALAGVEGLDLVAACRGDAAAVAEFTARFGGRPYTDWRALLADPQVEAVVVANRTICTRRSPSARPRRASTSCWRSRWRRTWPPAARSAPPRPAPGCGSWSGM